MNQSLQNALFELSKGQNIDEAPAEELENLIGKYPYFSVPHILLAKKLKLAGGESFAAQAQKAAIYINPFWLDYQLADDDPELFDLQQGTPDTVVQTFTGEPVTSHKGIQVEIGEEVSSPYVEAHAPVTEVPKKRNSAIIVETADAVTANGSASYVAATKQQDDLETGAALPNDLEADDQFVPDQFHPEPEIVQEEIESGEEIPSVPDEPEKESAPFLESTLSSATLPPNISAEVPKPISISEDELAKNEELLHKIVHHEPVAEEVIEPTAFSGDEVVSNRQLEEQVTEALEGHTIFAKDMEARTNALVNPAETAGEIPYEPFHTIDYFASQGIQLVLEKDPQDKLGKQLKKFTQWLKHMKKLGPEDALEAVKDTHLETTIQHIADSSNTPRDIVTETMAKILVKQGKTDQAIQLYHKLSFLIPAKSAYFAAEIQTLKGS